MTVDQAVAAEAKKEDVILTPTTPQDIARLSQLAFASCQKAAADLRAIGDACCKMGIEMESMCSELANDYEQHGQRVADHVNEFAKTVYERGQQVAALRDKIVPQPARPAAADEYGVRNSGLAAVGQGLEPLPQIVKPRR